MKAIHATLLMAAALAVAGTCRAQNADFGIWTDIGAEKKINKKWSVEAETSLRTRDNTSKFDRWSIGVATDYRIARWLKAGAGYDLLVDRRETSLSYHADGSVNKITPAFSQLRHRLHADLTASFKAGRFGFSLRERYQYTLRPTSHNRRYDTDTEEWSDMKSKSSHISRTRLNIEYNIRHCPLTPGIGGELFCGKGGVQKYRLTVGTDIKVDKHNVFTLCYRFQDVTTSDDDGNGNMHILGVGYTHKF